MTTELYPDDYFGGRDKIPPNYNIVERRWLIDEIIKPELPNIIDNVEKCLELLRSDQSFKMPISNGASNDVDTPSVRGIITRQRGFIIDFQAIVKFPQFHRGKAVMYKMDPDTKFPLLQINSITANLSEALNLLDSLQVQQDTDKFILEMGKILGLLTRSINFLQNPPRELVFPENNNNAIKKMFSYPNELCESTHHLMSLELVIFRNEISIDFRNLAKITTRPWCDIDQETGKSFTDVVRDKLKTERGKKLVDILKEQGLNVEEPSLLRNFFNTNPETTTLAQAQEILARCVTFDSKLVSECEKISITTSDPSLISISSKLNGLENCIGTYYTNLELA
ncbi:LAFE_0H05952g1_1 [Lachancea fermentati]|uniref:LAFE_0H05952g1_1 n=1 Tax=Lachancea fermentati TaxID=4955 RepID=A0A1G4MJT8_LACFM|nr:LAFE_0H05952g1_1 [Lachancea fermentati]